MTAKPWAAGLLCAVATTLSIAGCGGGGGSAKSFCSALASGPDPVALFGGYDPTSASKSELDAGIARLQDLKRSAPSDVKSALDQLIAVASDLESTLAARASNDAGAPPATMPASDTEKATKASAVVAQVMASSCGAPASATPG